MDTCPSCGGALTSRTLGRSSPADRAAAGSTGIELRRCASCRRLAQRDKGTSDDWTDAGLDPTIDYLFDWQPEPMPPQWTLVPFEDRAMLEAELGKEVAEGHQLFGQRVIAIARCRGCDEVVFSVETNPARFVSVHLTWRDAREQPPWPRIQYLNLPLSRSLAEHDH